MEKRLFISAAYDFYSRLLTERQRIVFEMYYLNDFSLQEVAEELNVSRQAVNDLLKRTEKIILEYEDKLKLYENYNIRKRQSESVRAVLDEWKRTGSINPGKMPELMQMVEKIIDTDS